MIRALIVDEIPLYRKGLSTTLEQTGDCAVIGEPTQLADILDLARAQHPDVIILSEDLASASALEVALLLLQAEQRGLFVLSEHLTEEQLFRFMLAGAAAYETRWISQVELVEKVQRVSRGEYLLSGDAIDSPRPAQLEAQRGGATPGGLHLPSQATLQNNTCPLSAGELQLLAHIAQGRSTKQIAQALAISEKVAHTRITCMLHKIGVHDRTLAVVHALKQQWIDFEGLQAYDSQQSDMVQPEASRPPPRPRAPSSRKTLSLAHSPSTPQVRYRLQWAFCGKARCKKCRMGEGHGPYWFEYKISGGRTTRRYIGKTLPPLVPVQESQLPMHSLS